MRGPASFQRIVAYIFLAICFQAFSEKEGLSAENSSPEPTPSSALHSRALQLLHSGGGCQQWAGSVGLLRFTEQLGLTNVARAFDAVKKVVSNEDLKRLKWLRPAPVEDLSQLLELRTRLVRSKDSYRREGSAVYVRFKDLMLVADLAEEFTHGDVDQLFAMVPSALNESERKRLKWPRLPAGVTSARLRLREDMRRFPERYQGAMAAVRASLLTDFRLSLVLDLLSAEADDAGVVLRPFRVTQSMQAGDLWTALRLVAGGMELLLEDFAGSAGLNRLTHSYFRNNGDVAYWSIWNVLEQEQFDQLGWPSMSEPLDISEPTPFYGRWAPIAPPKFLKVGQLTPKQSWRARQYIVWVLERGRHPIVSDWRGEDELVSRLSFYGLDRYAPGERLEQYAVFRDPNVATEAVAYVAGAHEITLDWLDAPDFRVPKSEKVRILVQDCAVARHLTWVVNHPYDPIIHSDWGLKPGKIGVDWYRYTGEREYSPGRDFERFAIFPNREEAFEQVRKRGKRLGLVLEENGTPILKRYLRQKLLNKSGQDVQPWAQGPEGLRTVANKYFQGESEIARQIARLHLPPAMFRALRWPESNEASWQALLQTNPELYGGPQSATLHRLHDLEIVGVTTAQALLIKQYLTWCLVQGRIPKHSDFGKGAGKLGFGTYHLNTEFGSHQNLMLIARREGGKVGIEINLLSVHAHRMSEDFFLARREQVAERLWSQGINAKNVTLQDALNLRPGSGRENTCAILMSGTTTGGRPLFRTLDELREYLVDYEKRKP